MCWQPRLCELPAPGDEDDPGRRNVDGEGAQAEPPRPVTSWSRSISSLAPALVSSVGGSSPASRARVCREDCCGPVIGSSPRDPFLGVGFRLRGGVVLLTPPVSNQGSRQ